MYLALLFISISGLGRHQLLYLYICLGNLILSHSTLSKVGSDVIQSLQWGYASKWQSRPAVCLCAPCVDNGGPWGPTSSVTAPSSETFHIWQPFQRRANSNQMQLFESLYTPFRLCCHDRTLQVPISLRLKIRFFFFTFIDIHQPFSAENSFRQAKLVWN